MGLLDKFFNGGGNRRPRSDPFEDTGAGDDEADTEASRLDRLKRVLRETMRRHAVPSDWIECRGVTVRLPRGDDGLQVVFVVRPGQAREVMLTYIPAFQASVHAELLRIDPKCGQWLLGMAWQFDGIDAKDGGTSLLPKSPPRSGPAPLSPVSTPAPLELNLPAAPRQPKPDDEAAVREDLEALFAIRDAALRAQGTPDFEPTRPAGEAGDEPPPRR